MKPPLFSILIILVFTIVAIYFLAVCYTTFLYKVEQGENQELFMRSEPQNTPQIVLISDNTILPHSAVYYPKPRTYASLSNKYNGLIECLIKYESRGDPKAYNPHDPVSESIGILQFKRKTYQYFCVDKYGLDDDIWNEDLQKLCCEKMLKSNINNIKHWSVWQKCY